MLQGRRVQDMDDGSVHINTDTHGLLIYSGPLTPVRSSSGELIKLRIYFLFMQAACHSLLLSFINTDVLHTLFLFLLWQDGCLIIGQLAAASIKNWDLTAWYKTISKQNKNVFLYYTSVTSGGILRNYMLLFTWWVSNEIENKTYQMEYFINICITLSIMVLALVL